MPQSVEEYVLCRMGTSAVNIGITCYACVQEIEIPQTDTLHTEIEKIYDATNKIISYVNDLASLKKELANNSVDNIVPLLWLSTNSVDSAISMVVKLIKQAKEDFDAAERELLRMTCLTYAGLDQVRDFIESCKTSCTGNLMWRWVRPP